MLEIHNLSKESQAGIVVDNFSLKALPGEIICVQCPGESNGRNFAKIFCEILIGMRRQSTGSIAVDTYDMTFEPEMAKRLIGYVPKDGPQSSPLGGKEFLNLTDFLFNIPDTSNKASNEAWLDGYIKDYSVEQKLRLSLHASLSHNPKLLLLDRPFDGINQETRQLLVNALNDFAAKQGIVIFTTSSIESQLVGLASRAVSIKETV